MITLRAYARHRAALGLPGASLKAVQLAIDSGRLHAALDPDGNIISAELADAAWLANTDASRVPLTGRTAPIAEQIAATTPAAAIPPLLESRARREAARARLAERELAAHEGRYIDVEEAARDLQTLLVNLRNSMLGIPARLRNHGVTSDEHRRIAPLVDDLIREALEDFASGKIAGMRADGDPAPLDAPDDES